MKTDYPELEGATIKYNTGDRIIDGTIVGCCYDVGITIVESSNKTSKLLCINRIKQAETEEPEQYYQEFLALIKLLKTGYLHADQLDIVFGCYDGGAKDVTMSCPYSM